MRFGIHVSVGGGLKKGVLRAAAIGCETIQIFSSNPMGWKMAPLDPEAAAEFSAAAEEHDIWPVFVHTPYLVNLASHDEEILRKSRETMLAVMQRAELLQAEYVVTHIGSHKGAGFERGLATVIESAGIILANAESAVTLLLENTAGGGGEMGRSFEELAQILDGLSEFEARLGVCLDTAHLWGAGLDISTAERVEAALQGFDAELGIGRLQLVHANDTTVKLDSRRDIHQPPGKGVLGAEGFRALVNHPQLVDVPLILETPTEDAEGIAQELCFLRGLRS